MKKSVNRAVSNMLRKGGGLMAYTTKSGDTWDGIAKSVYGDELKADVLMAANREYIEIYRFDSGIELVTPDIEEEVAANDNLPPWKR